MVTSGERGAGTRHREGLWGADKGVCLTVSYTFASCSFLPVLLYNKKRTVSLPFLPQLMVHFISLPVETGGEDGSRVKSEII